MRLAEFILQNLEAILVQWELFASTLLPAAGHMQELELRDHALQILQAVAKDLDTPQTRDAQSEKSMGRAPIIPGAPETAAQTHGMLRAKSGFSIVQLAAEFRALRASVLRLWKDAHPQLSPEDLEDMIRFNEAIDQALAESIGFFGAKVDESRNLMLGMLGHDLRSPLQTIQMTAAYLATINAGGQVSEASTRLIKSGARMKDLLDDLLDFNRTQLGLGIEIRRADVDLGGLFADQVDQLRAAHPDRQIDLETLGDCRGHYDGHRMQQVLDNLATNALKYGDAKCPVRIVLSGSEAEIRLEVQNAGAQIDESELYRLFEPLTRGSVSERTTHDRSSLGLGLFIAREITKRHAGRIDVRSDHAGTVFSVRLPRTQAA